MRTSGPLMVVSPCYMSPDCLADLRIVVVEDHATPEEISIYSWVNWGQKSWWQETRLRASKR
jgi:hypothetical protein